MQKACDKDGVFREGLTLSSLLPSHSPSHIRASMT